MRVTHRQLRRVIRETIRDIQGIAAGPNKGRRFSDIALDAMANNNYSAAADAIMDAFFLDDVWPEEVAALEDALSMMSPSQRSVEDLNIVANQWADNRVAGKLRKK